MPTPTQGVIFGVAFLAAILYATSTYGSGESRTISDKHKISSSPLVREKGHRPDQGHHHHDQKPNPCRHLSKDPAQCVENPDCSFCLQPDFCKFRCDTPDNLDDNGCSAENIINEITLTSTLSQGTISTPIRLPIVPGRAVNLTVTFDMTNLLLDVYFNVDFTGSMTDDRFYIMLHANDFVLKLQELFPNSRLGFGTFTDKAKEPFGNLTTRYSFWHIMDLTPTTAIANLQQTIFEVPHFIGRGIDLLDAQLDSWTQISTCHQEIGGWRPQEAVKFIFSITDGDYHIAGDGKAGNITTPYDETCQVNADHKYLGINMDYPSIPQFTSVLTNTNTNLIVAFLSDFILSYEKLLAGLPFTSQLIPLLESSETVADLFINAFKNITDKFGIQQSDTSNTPEIRIRYFTDCSVGEGSPVEERANCTTLNYSDVVTFTVQIELESCPANEANWVQTVRINPFGVPYLFQDIELFLICESETCPPIPCAEHGHGHEHSNSNSGTKFSNKPPNC